MIGRFSTLARPCRVAEPASPRQRVRRALPFTAPDSPRTTWSATHSREPRKYGYRPTPAQMSFGQLMVHIVQTNVALCSGISGISAPWTPEELKKLAETDPKDSLVAAIKRSFDYCTDAIAKVNDSRLAEEVTMFGRPTGMSRAAALITIAADWADHYSTAASYLRPNGILPPTAQPKK